MDPLLKVENLSIIYNLGKSSEATAVLDANIEIYPGEYVILYGPSGCGKSTILYAISGMEAPTKGKIWFKGRDLSEFSSKSMVDFRRKKVGMVFQSYNLIPTLTVLDNVILPHLLGEFNKKKTYLKAESLLEKFKIRELKHRYPSELSGGQQQRVAIARSLIYDPAILLADEPVGNLDSKSAEIAMGLFKEINEKEKKTIILVTHDPSFLHYAHKVYHIKDGKIIREVFNQAEAQKFYGKRKGMLSAELTKLAKVFPHFSQIQLRAKALANYLTESLDIDRMQTLEKVIEKLILGKINTEEFHQFLDLPLEKGGVGFYQSTAKKYKDKAKEILSQAKFIKKELQAEEKESETVVKELDKLTYSLRTSLLDSYNGQISFEQLEKLNRFIKGRLLARLDRKQFQRCLDLPLKKGGVGLNVATARNFTKKLEIILSQTGKL